MYSLVSIRVVYRSQYIALVLVLTDFVPYSIRGLISIKRDYLGSSTVPASVDVRSVGRLSTDIRVRRVVVVRSIGRSVGIRVQLTDIRVAWSVDELVQSERGYCPARASP